MMQLSFPDHGAYIRTRCHVGWHGYSGSCEHRRLRGRKGSLDDPPAWMNDKAGLISKFADDLDADQCRHGNAGAGIGAASIRQPHEAVPATRHLEHWHGTVAVLHVGGLDQQFQRAAIGVDHVMALAPFDLLAGIIPFGPPASVVFTL